MERIDRFLSEKKKQHLLRTLNPVSQRREGKVSVQGREYIDFSSNDYLGLASHPFLCKAVHEAVDTYGIGASASRLLSGDYELCHILEDTVARFKGTEASLVFNSGYQANVGIISALCGKDDVIFLDKLCHASILDGVMLSGARFFRFAHNDMSHLQMLLKKQRASGQGALIITESIFSMDGDKALLKDVVALKNQYDCKCMVDEAHATGIFGVNGSGLVEEEGLSDQIELIMGTFGKALGGFGAYVACAEKTKQYLLNTARSFIYSTALPPCLVAVNLASIKLIQEEPFRRKSLLSQTAYMRAQLSAAGFSLHGSSQIIPLIVGDTMKTIIMSRRLQEFGYWVLPIRPPTVPINESRLRFSVNIDHTMPVLETLVHRLTEIRQEVF